MSETALPSHASVIVIGGGVMGCSTLHHLAKEGVSDAILLERNQLTSGTTWHSAAQVRALRSTRSLTELIRYSISLYSQLESETGQATGWINKGSLSIATNAARLTHIRRQESLAHLFGVKAQSISRAEVKERWPLMNVEDVLGAVWSPDDGRVSPSDLCAALVKGARSRGARIFENTGAIGILSEADKVIGVETRGGVIRCDAIALCTGLWSRQAASMAGVDAPVWPCEHFYLLTKPIEGISGNLPSLSDHDAHLYIRDDSGGLLVGCFEPLGKALDPASLGEEFAFQLLPEDWDHFEPMMVNALHRLPALETAQVRMLLNGPESFTPDGAFLLGESAEMRGFYLGCGMNSVGVATGGGAGMALAHCIVHGAMPMDLHEVDPKRFPACFNSVDALAARVPEVLGRHYEISFPGRQWASARMLEKTPLHHKWVEASAHFGQFFGIERPLYFNKLTEPEPTFARPDWFDQVGKEVRQAHLRAGLFDQSTFGKIRVSGDDAERFLNRVCANNMSRPAGRAVYTAMLNERGGIESDLTALRLSRDCYRLYVSTTSIKKDLAWLQRHVMLDERVTLRDETHEHAVLALMGPDAARIAAAVGAGLLNSLAYFQHGEAEIAGVPILGTRLSYIGEAGWELTCPTRGVADVYAALHQAGARPVGLFAQSSMRIEKRYLAYGHDIDSDVSPIEAGLGFAVHWAKEFIGREALSRQRDEPPKSRIVSIVLDDEQATPLGSEPVYLNGEILGVTTSAAFGYRVGKPVALAMIDTGRLAGAGRRSLQVDIAGARFSGSMTPGAVFDPEGTRMRLLASQT